MEGVLARLPVLSAVTSDIVVGHPDTIVTIVGFFDGKDSIAKCARANAVGVAGGSEESEYKKDYENSMVVHE